MPNSLISLRRLVVALWEKAVEAFRSYMPVRQVVVEAKDPQDHPTQDHPTRDHPSHGYEKLKMHAFKVGNVKAYLVFMQNGYLMASTHYGSYVVAEPNDVMDWMLRHNHIMLSLEDAKDECGSDVERDTNSSVDDCGNSASESDEPNDDENPYFMQISEAYRNSPADFEDPEDEANCALKVRIYQPNGDFLFTFPLANPRLSVSDLKVKMIEKIVARNPSSTLVASGFSLYHDTLRLSDYIWLIDILNWGDTTLNLTMHLLLKGGGKVGIKAKKDVLKAKKMEKFKGMIEKVKGETTFDIEVQNVLSIPPETFISQAISFLNVEQLNALLKVQSEEIEHGERIVKKIAPLIVPLIAGMKEQVVKYENGMTSMEHAVMMAFVQKYWDGKFNLSSFFQEVSNRMVALNTRAEVMAQMAQGYGTDTSMTG